MVTKKDVKLGKNIALLRKKAGLTQEQLAEKTNLSLTFIGYLEIGQKSPALKTLNKIATALKVRVKDLIPYWVSISNHPHTTQIVHIPKPLLPLSNPRYIFKTSFQSVKFKQL